MEIWKPIVNAINGVFTKIYNALPENVRNALDVLTNYFNYVYNGAYIAVQVLTSMVIPYGGTFYLLYWVNLILRCVREGSIEPIAEHARKMIMLISAIVQGIRAILPVP